LEWADIRALQLRDRDEREDRDRHRSRFAQMRRNPHAEIDPKMGACDDLCYICSQLKTLSCSRHEGSLHEVVLYASTPTVIEGTTYDIPLIVHACIDVLRRTGLSIFLNLNVASNNLYYFSSYLSARVVREASES